MKEVAKVILAIFYKLPLVFSFHSANSDQDFILPYSTYSTSCKAVEFWRIQVVFVAEVSKYFKCLNSPTYSMIFDQLFEEITVAVQLYSLCCE